ATQGGGVAVFDNDLSDGEKKLAGTWWKALELPVAKPKGPTLKFEAVAALAKFEPKELSKQEVSALFAASVKNGRTDLPGRWFQYPAYVKDDAARKAANESGALVGDGKDAGIAIYKIRNHLKKHPDSPPLEFLLGEALRRGDQAEEAQKH